MNGIFLDLLEFIVRSSGASDVVRRPPSLQCRDIARQTIKRWPHELHRMCHTLSARPNEKGISHGRCRGKHAEVRPPVAVDRPETAAQRRSHSADFGNEWLP